jgi:2-polyprenyl-6-methoxyphenol hydroxylase-like FAD-dependent oxidoreductase
MAASPIEGSRARSINLLPHAARELDALGVLETVRAHPVAPKSLLYCTKRGQEIWREARGLAAGYPWPQLSIHRGRLQEVLLGAVVECVGAERFHLGGRVVATEDAGAVTFADGTRVEADLVVAADGIHSAARRQRYPDEGPALWNGALLWRGVVDTRRVLDGRTMVWAGHPDQKFVAYPIADLSDGRQRINFIAVLRRPDSELVARSVDWNRRGELDDFLPMFLGWKFEWLDVPALLGAAPETFLFPMVDRDPLRRWTFGRSTLLGDAAHPMYPIGSNGASEAILDACTLAGCLQKHRW